MASPQKLPYGKRAIKQKNPAAKLLLETMERKKSNLAVSVDVTRSRDFLAIVDVVGPFVCLIKAITFSSESSCLPFSLNIQDTHRYYRGL